MACFFAHRAGCAVDPVLVGHLSAVMAHCNSESAVSELPSRYHVHAAQADISKHTNAYATDDACLLSCVLLTQIPLTPFAMPGTLYCVVRQLCQACVCYVQEEQAPCLARASRRSIPDYHDMPQPSSEIESLVDLTGNAPPIADYFTAVKSFNRTAIPAGGVRGVSVDVAVTAAPVLEASRANSKADLVPSFGSSSPLLPADAYSSFQVPHQPCYCLL